MAVALDDFEGHVVSDEDRNVIVVWQGDTVALCMGPDPDDVAVEVAEQLVDALVRCGVDPAMIVVSNGGDQPSAA